MLLIVFTALSAVFLICFLVDFPPLIVEPIITAAPPAAMIAPIVFAADTVFYRLSAVAGGDGNR